MSHIKVVIRGEIIAECQHSRSGGCHNGEAAIETLVPALRTCCYVIPRYCEMHPTVNQIATLKQISKGKRPLVMTMFCLVENRKGRIVASLQNDRPYKFAR